MSFKLVKVVIRAKGIGVVHRPVPVRRVFPLKKMSVDAQGATAAEHWPRSAPDNPALSEHIDLREDTRISPLVQGH